MRSGIVTCVDFQGHSVLRVDLVVVELVSFLVTGFVCLFVLNTLRESESKLMALGVFCVVSLVTYYVCIAVLLFTIANPEIVASETLDFGTRITVWIGNVVAVLLVQAWLNRKFPGLLSIK